MGIAQPTDTAITVFSQSLLRSLQRSRYQVHLYGDSLFYEYFKNPKIISFDQMVSIHWDVAIIQNSLCFSRYPEIMRLLRKTPVVFVSNADDISGYIAPFDNLYTVLSTVGGWQHLSSWNIPFELCRWVPVPVLVSGNHYLYEEEPDCYEFVYYPFENSSAQIDSKILSLTRLSNCRLSIIGEEYRTLKSVMNKRVRIVSRSQSVGALKKAHLVLASRYQAVQAIALCKPCVVIGSHGLGGRVTPDNYETFKRHGFKGRNGAAADEHIPLDLLQFDIKRALDKPCEEETVRLRDMLLADDYSFGAFHSVISKTVANVIKLHEQLHNRKLYKKLKPRLSSTLSIKKMNEKNLMLCGDMILSEIDDDMEALLRKCDGSNTIENIVIESGYEHNDISVFAENVMEMWKKKLVVFNL